MSFPNNWWPNSSIFWFTTGRKVVWNWRFGNIYRSHLPASRCLSWTRRVITQKTEEFSWTAAKSLSSWSYESTTVTQSNDWTQYVSLFWHCLTDERTAVIRLRRSSKDRKCNIHYMKIKISYVSPGSHFMSTKLHAARNLSVTFVLPNHWLHVKLQGPTPCKLWLQYLLPPDTQIVAVFPRGWSSTTVYRTATLIIEPYVNPCRFLRNICNHSPNNTASQPRRQNPTATDS
jgi:hypothetical protein